MDFWQPPRPCPQRIIPQQCPLSDLMTVQPLFRAYFRAASISLLGCRTMRLSPRRDPTPRSATQIPSHTTSAPHPVPPCTPCPPPLLPACNDCPPRRRR